MKWTLIDADTNEAECDPTIVEWARLAATPAPPRARLRYRIALLLKLSELDGGTLDLDVIATAAWSKVVSLVTFDVSTEAMLTLDRFVKLIEKQSAPHVFYGVE